MIAEPLPAAPKLIAPKFGNWLKTQRGERRSMEQLATRVRKHVEDFGLKVDRSSISKWEDGRIPPWVTKP